MNDYFKHIQTNKVHSYYLFLAEICRLSLVYALNSLFKCMYLQTTGSQETSEKEHFLEQVLDHFLNEKICHLIIKLCLVRIMFSILEAIYEVLPLILIDDKFYRNIV